MTRSASHLHYKKTFLVAPVKCRSTRQGCRQLFLPKNHSPKEVPDNLYRTKNPAGIPSGCPDRGEVYRWCRCRSTHRLQAGMPPASSNNPLHHKPAPLTNRSFDQPFLRPTVPPTNRSFDNRSFDNLAHDKPARWTYPRDVFREGSGRKHPLRKAAVLRPESGKEAKHAVICSKKRRIWPRDGCVPFTFGSPHAAASMGWSGQSSVARSNSRQRSQPGRRAVDATKAQPEIWQCAPLPPPTPEG